MIIITNNKKQFELLMTEAEGVEPEGNNNTEGEEAGSSLLLLIF